MVFLRVGSLLALAGVVRAANEGPCDIFEAAATPCVAAHSTVRALYAAYAGPLYEVRRADDNATFDVMARAGVADAEAQDDFCGASDCVVSKIFDQSPRGNDLAPAPGGGCVHTPDAPVNATREKLTLGGRSVYSLYFEGGMGYRNDDTSGVAVGDEPETIYMVASGRRAASDERRVFVSESRPWKKSRNRQAPLQRQVLLRLRQRRDGRQRRGRGHDGGRLLRERERGPEPRRRGRRAASRVSRDFGREGVVRRRDPREIER